jgi:hypothetical protein
MHDEFFPGDGIPLYHRSWTISLNWAVAKIASRYRKRLAELLRPKNQFLLHVRIRSLRPYSLGELENSEYIFDRRPWEMFLLCTEYSETGYFGTYLYPSTADYTGFRIEHPQTKAVQTERIRRAGRLRNIFNSRGLLCDFIRLFRNEDICKLGRASPRELDTKPPATAFENVLFLSMVVLNRRTKGDSAKYYIGAAWNGSSTGYRSSSDQPQRIGWSIKAVVQAWDSLPRTLGFKDVESMIEPYIVFDHDAMMYVAIREGGASSWPCIGHRTLSCAEEKQGDHDEPDRTYRASLVPRISS